MDQLLQKGQTFGPHGARFETLRLLGSGTFSAVYECLDKRPGAHSTSSSPLRGTLASSPQNNVKDHHQSVASRSNDVASLFKQQADATAAAAAASSSPQSTNDNNTKNESSPQPSKPNSLHDHHRVAIKTSQDTSVYRHAMLREAVILRQLKTMDEVPQIIMTFDRDNRIHLVQEMMHGGNLYEYVASRNYSPVPIAAIRKVMERLLRVLKKLHRQLGYMHCDIKLENIMFREDSSPTTTTTATATTHNISAFDQICLIDFGSSRLSVENKYFDIQSLWYRAPEVCCGIPYGPPIDVWSIGCVGYELLCAAPLVPADTVNDALQRMVNLFGKLPSKMQKVSSSPVPNRLFESSEAKFGEKEEIEKDEDDTKNDEDENKVVEETNQQQNQKEESSATVSPSLQFLLSEIKGCPESLRHLLTSMLKLDPEERISVDAALDHPFFKDNQVDKAHHDALPSYLKQYSKISTEDEKSAVVPEEITNNNVYLAEEEDEECVLDDDEQEALRVLAEQEQMDKKRQEAREKRRQEIEDKFEKEEMSRVIDETIKASKKSESPPPPPPPPLPPGAPNFDEIEDSAERPPPPPRYEPSGLSSDEDDNIPPPPPPPPVVEKPHFAEYDEPPLSGPNAVVRVGALIPPPHEQSPPHFRPFGNPVVLSEQDRNDFERARDGGGTEHHHHPHRRSPPHAATATRSREETLQQLANTTEVADDPRVSHLQLPNQVSEFFAYNVAARSMKNYSDDKVKHEKEIREWEQQRERQQELEAYQKQQEAEKESALQKLAREQQEHKDPNALYERSMQHANDAVSRLIGADISGSPPWMHPQRNPAPLLPSEDAQQLSQQLSSLAEQSEHDNIEVTAATYQSVEATSAAWNQVMTGGKSSSSNQQPLNEEDLSNLTEEQRQLLNGQGRHLRTARGDSWGAGFSKSKDDYAQMQQAQVRQFQTDHREEEQRESERRSREDEAKLRQEDHDRLRKDLASAGSTSLDSSDFSASAMSSSTQQVFDPISGIFKRHTPHEVQQHHRSLYGPAAVTSASPDESPPRFLQQGAANSSSSSNNKNGDAQVMMLQRPSAGQRAAATFFLKRYATPPLPLEDGLEGMIDDL